MNASYAKRKLGEISKNLKHGLLAKIGLVTYNLMSFYTNDNLNLYLQYLTKSLITSPLVTLIYNRTGVLGVTKHTDSIYIYVCVYISLVW